ncbi:MAG: peptide chain release factor 1 [Gammaproteobacteria bacterium]|nr:peptide chain release factor 1 [Gammaproteobacteria bacterium]NNK99622.1 peptide chain release factor 1 [Xanthomonadales bacterium]
MLPSLHARLHQAQERYEEIALLLATPDVLGNQNRFRELSVEYSQLGPVVETWEKWQQAGQAMEEAQALLKSQDAEMQDLANEELSSATQQQEVLENELNILLLPKDPDDDNNIFLEIRAGTGGDEAALFAGDLFRMYQRYVEKNNWQMEIINTSSGDHGGFKEIVARIVGRGAYSRFKFESGTHRVQRVPETESQGRIHTSACTVAILAERENIEGVDIQTADLRIDTFRASGAGGQHVNTTDSAIRITHLPTGLVVECQDERSQHKNKARAMSLLSARLLEQEKAEQAREQAENRKLQVGSGDRSQRIRTYNFPQGRVTDHRIGLTLYKLEELLGGGLDMFIEPLTLEHQAELLNELGN